MTTMPTSSWNIFLDSVGSMKTSRLLPHTPLWVSHFRHIFTRPLSSNGRQAPSILYLRDAPFELAHNKLDSKHHLMPSTLGLTMRSHDPTRYIFYALCV